MYADPKHLREHRVNLSLDIARKTRLETQADEHGMQPSVYALKLLMEGMDRAEHASNCAPVAIKMLATQ